MTTFKRRLATSGLVAAIYVVWIVLAALEDYLLQAGAHGGLVFWALTSFVLFPTLIASGLFPALALHHFRLRSGYIYLANALFSATFASCILLYTIKVWISFVVGPSTKGGAPPFASTFANSFRDFPQLVQSEWKTLIVMAVLAFLIAALCAVYFWLYVVRRRVL